MEHGKWRPHSSREAALKSFEGESRGETFSKVSPLAAGGIRHPAFFLSALSG
jgi:hypothetical protein